MVYSPDGTKIASGSVDKTLKIWNAQTGQCATVDSGVSSVAFSPDGSKIAAAHWKEISIFDAQTLAKLGSSLTVDSMVLGISYSPSGDTLAVGCYNGKIFLVDAGTATVKRSLSGHSDR